METSLATRKLQAIELITKLENEDLLTFIEQLLIGEKAEPETYLSQIPDKCQTDIVEGGAFYFCTYLFFFSKNIQPIGCSRQYGKGA